MLSAKWRQFCLSLNVLKETTDNDHLWFVVGIAWDMPKDKYESPNPRRTHILMSQDDVANGKRSSYYELEISGKCQGTIIGIVDDIQSIVLLEHHWSKLRRIFPILYNGNLPHMPIWLQLNRFVKGHLSLISLYTVFETQSKSCRSSCLESQIINIKLKKTQQKVPGPPPKLSASDRRTCGNFQHCLYNVQYWNRVITVLPWGLIPYKDVILPI